LAYQLQDLAAGAAEPPLVRRTGRTADSLGDYGADGLAMMYERLEDNETGSTFPPLIDAGAEELGRMLELFTDEEQPHCQAMKCHFEALFGPSTPSSFEDDKGYISELRFEHGGAFFDFFEQCYTTDRGHMLDLFDVSAYERFRTYRHWSDFNFELPSRAPVAPGSGRKRRRESFTWLKEEITRDMLSEAVSSLVEDCRSTGKRFVWTDLKHLLLPQAKHVHVQSAHCVKTRFLDWGFADPTKGDDAV